MMGQDSRLQTILCVCLGNICRSPMAEGVLRAHAAAAGLDLRIDSAGTGGWHIGTPPDPRAKAAAMARGIDISGQRARQVAREDFHRFDLILAMDASNLAALRRLRPAQATAEIQLFDPGGREVPDPYYGGDDGFEAALDMIEAAVAQRLNGG